jgi:hypothetical protein
MRWLLRRPKQQHQCGFLIFFRGGYRVGLGVFRRDFPWSVDGVEALGPLGSGLSLLVDPVEGLDPLRRGFFWHVDRVDGLVVSRRGLFCPADLVEVLEPDRVSFLSPRRGFCERGIFESAIMVRIFAPIVSMLYA